MKERLSSLASQLPDEKDNPWPYRVIFGLDLVDPPVDCYQVPFSWIEFVLSGTHCNTICDVHSRVVDCRLGRGDCLFIGANRWNRPVWTKDSTVASLLFGNRHLGLSLMTWNAESASFSHVEKYNCLIPAGSPLYPMLNALTGFQSEEQGISFHCRMLARSIIEYSFQLLEHPVREEVSSQTRLLYHNVCDYMRQNYEKALSRDTLADHFGVGPNYLSRVFKRTVGRTPTEFRADNSGKPARASIA